MASLTKGRTSPPRTRYFLHEARGDELGAFGCGQEDGFDVRMHAVIHRRHLNFVFEIRHGAQAAHDDRGADLLRKMHQKIVERDDGDIGSGERFNLALDHFHARRGVEQGAFACVFGNADNQLVNHPRGAVNDIHMPACDRVERAGVEADAGFGVCHHEA